MASIGASIWRIIAISSLLSLSIGCGGTHPDAKQAQSASADPPSVLVTVVPVQRAPIANTLLAYGTVNFSPEGAHVMTVQAEEVVAQLLVDGGQPVGEGEQFRL